MQKIKKNIDESEYFFKKLNTHNTVKKNNQQKKIKEN